jgi:hypothetical protein
VAEKDLNSEIPWKTLVVGKVFPDVWPRWMLVTQVSFAFALTI